jgi:hypothetical protein
VTGGRGRPAALPSVGYRPNDRRAGLDLARVQFVPENPAEPPCEFDFTELPVSTALQEAFAEAFLQRTRSGGRVRTVASADKSWRHLRGFSRYLGELTSPPTSPAELTPAHLRGWYLPKSDHSGGSIVLGELKTTLRKIEGLNADFVELLGERMPPRLRKGSKASYSRSENQRILNAARSDVRRAAERIRGGRLLLSRWRAGDLADEPESVRRLAKLLNFIDTHCDVPRYDTAQALPKTWVGALGTVTQHMTTLHLGWADAAAFAVLLVGLTGQNRGTMLRAPAHHHRPDGHTGESPSAIIEMDKPRRGPHRRHMDVPLTSIPRWAEHGMPTGDEDSGQAQDRADLHSPFGVYMLLHDLAESARNRARSDRLLVWWGAGGPTTPPGLRTDLHSDLVRQWAHGRGLRPDSGQGLLNVTLDRLRLTFNELQQRPVAHTDTTLVNEYLARNRGNLPEYQQVVASTLAEQVAKASTRGRLQTLTADEVAEARKNPAKIAKRHGMDTATLQRLLAGELDTVLGACIDNTNSPHTPAGQHCRASFMLCLGCPCARATPAHLPLQVLIHDQLEARKAAVTPMRWAQRFALPHSQLTDLLERAGAAAVADARAAATPGDAELADRFLNRELGLS